jgi:hypothetical protein
MATETKPDPKVLAKIQIPGEYFHAIHGFFGSLGDRIVEEAVTRTAQRGEKVATLEDFFGAVDEVFPEGALDVRKALTH